MKKILSGIIVVVLVIIIIMMIVGIKKQKEEVIKITKQEQTIQEQQDSPKQSITVKHQYKDGMHTYVGSLDLPSPCHTAEITSQLTAATNSVVVDITTLAPKEDVVCPQVITPTPFEITFMAPKNAEVFFTINNSVAVINQFEIPPAQNIDAVDLYSKG